MSNKIPRAMRPHTAPQTTESIPTREEILAAASEVARNSIAEAYDRGDDPVALMKLARVSARARAQGEAAQAGKDAADQLTATLTKIEELAGAGVSQVSDAVTKVTSGVKDEATTTTTTSAVEDNSSGLKVFISKTSRAMTPSKPTKEFFVSLGGGMLMLFGLSAALSGGLALGSRLGPKS